MTAPSSPPSADSALRAELRELLDDEVLRHTGRSVGDLASGYVVDALMPLIDEHVARRVQEARADELEQAADWNDERPEMRVSRHAIAAVLRNQAQRLRATPTPTSKEQET